MFKAPYHNGVKIVFGEGILDMGRHPVELLTADKHVRLK